MFIYVRILRQEIASNDPNNDRNKRNSSEFQNSLPDITQLVLGIASPYKIQILITIMATAESERIPKF